MTKRYHKPLTAAEIAALTDHDIDFSDIPELDDAFLKKARLARANRLEDIELNAIADTRANEPRIAVKLDDL
jgi:hypothetical protein